MYFRKISFLALHLEKMLYNSAYGRAVGNQKVSNNYYLTYGHKVPRISNAYSKLQCTPIIIPPLGICMFCMHIHTRQGFIVYCHLNQI